MIITIDGPSGTGKTTVARKVADRLNFNYFDTGAMYRAFTWYVLQHHVDLNDLSSVKQLLADFNFKISDSKNEKRYFIQDHDVTDVIRSQIVTDRVSAVSALKEVRDALLGTQLDYAKKHNAVFEGRDLGTVVFPDAEVKIFLTADPQVRAMRRLDEMAAKNPEDAKDLDRDKMLSSLMRRDELDSTREIAPLKCPPDATQIDTTALTIDEVVECIVNCVGKK